jgi:hypothetical protein
MKIEIHLRGRYEPLIYDFPEPAAAALGKDFLNFLDHGFPRGGSYLIVGAESASQTVSLNFEAVASLLAPADLSAESGVSSPVEDLRLMQIRDVSGLR